MDLYVFSNNYTPLGILSSPVAISYIERVRSRCEFSVYLPVNDINAELAVEDNIILFDSEKGIAGVINGISKSTASGVPVLTVKGGLCDEYMYRRICWGMYSKTGAALDVIADMITTQITSPEIAARAIPDFVVDASKMPKGSDITYQSTGGIVGENVDSICATSKLCRRVKFDPVNKKMVFSVFEGTDRTVGQSDVPPCVFSQSFENLLETAYDKDLTDFRNVALVGGEEKEEGNRVFIEVGDSAQGSAQGKVRREIFIDAKSVRSKQSDGTVLNDTQYKALLSQKAGEKMEQLQPVQNFDCTVNVLGNIRYGVDYYLGDKVTIRDVQLGVELDAEIAEVERAWASDGETMYITFGFGPLTLAEKLRVKEVR